VKISNLSKSSYYLYKSYIRHSPLLICPCHVKRNVALVVEDVFDNGVVLLRLERGGALTMTFVSDLEPVFERG